MTDIFVTAIYGDESVKLYGGRNNRSPRYIDSLKHISRIGNQIVCFCGSDDLKKLEREFQSYSNVQFIVMDLHTVRFHPRIRYVMSKNVEKYSEYFWTQRCPEIMYGKFHFLEIVMNRYPSNNVYWIDAGLAHQDVISEKQYSGYDKIFTKQFSKNLRKFGNEKLICAFHTSPNNPPIHPKYNSKSYPHNGGLVGGLFGGPVSLLSEMCSIFQEKVKTLIDDMEIVSEESIMSGIWADHPEWFTFHVFQTWWNRDKGEPRDERTSFSDWFIVFCS